MKPSDKHNTRTFRGLGSTIVVGVILGSVLGNVIYSVGENSFSIGRLIISVLGAVIGLFVVAWLARRFRNN